MHHRIIPACIALLVCLVVVSPVLADTIYLPLASSNPSATVTTSPTSSPTATASPTSTPTSQTSFLTNGDFEQGDTQWTHQGDASIINDTKLAHAGNSYARLGGHTSGEQLLAQRVIIPTNAISLTLWYTAASDEISCYEDLGFVRLNVKPDKPSSVGELIGNVTDFCKDRQHSSYAKLSFNIKKYAGTTVQLEFSLNTDAFLDSFWSIDDVAFVTLGAPHLPATATPTETPTAMVTPTLTMTPSATATSTPTATPNVLASLVVTHTSTYTSTNERYVVGEVLNTGSASAFNTQVTAKFYDVNNTLVGTVTDNTFFSEILAGNRTSPFKLYLSNAPTSIVRYEVNVISASTTSYTSYRRIAIVSQQTRDNNGTEVFGEGRNDQGVDLQFVKVSATFYDAAGTVVATSYTFAQPTTVTAGTTGTYTINFFRSLVWATYSVQTEGTVQ